MKTSKEIAADIARELREHPERWMQGRSASTPTGDTVDVNSPRASKWCLSGHIQRRQEDSFSLLALLDPFVRCAGMKVTDFNDHQDRTVDEIVALCDRVAAS